MCACVRRCPDGKIRLFCKGADTMIMTRIKQGQPIIPHVRKHLVSLSAAAAAARLCQRANARGRRQLTSCVCMIYAA